MRRPLKVCHCGNTHPCQDHTPTPWQGTTRRTRTLNGWAQQRRAQRILREHADQDGSPTCHVCGKPGADQVDHVQPLSQGGTDTDENLRPIHAKPCHQNKTQQEARARNQT